VFANLEPLQDHGDGHHREVAGGQFVVPDGDEAEPLEAFDGALAGDDGPIRLVVPDDTKGGRYVNGIVSIDVFTVAGPAATPAA